MKHFVLVVLLFFLFLVRGAVSIQAQEASGSAQNKVSEKLPAIPSDPLDITVSPVAINIETEPGKAVPSSLRVFNNGVSPEYLELGLATFVASEDGERPIIKEFGPTDEEKNWISFSQPHFVAEPGVWKTIEFSFNPPATASLSYYYALVVKRQVTAPAQGGETVVDAAPAVLLVTTVSSPNIKRELQITDVKVTKMIYEFVPAEFEITVKNTGNVHLAPLGDIFIEQGQKKDIGIIPINSGKGLVLPNSERTYRVRWEDGFPAYKPVIENGEEVKDEKGTTKYVLHWDWTQLTKLRLGRYVATILLVYDDGQRDIPLEALVSFWIVPWRSVLALGIIGLIMLSGLCMPFFLFARRFSRKK